MKIQQNNNQRPSFAATSEYVPRLTKEAERIFRYSGVPSFPSLTPFKQASTGKILRGLGRRIKRAYAKNPSMKEENTLGQVKQTILSLSHGVKVFLSRPVESVGQDVTRFEVHLGPKTSRDFLDGLIVHRAPLGKKDKDFDGFVKMVDGLHE